MGSEENGTPEFYAILPISTTPSDVWRYITQHPRATEKIVEATLDAGFPVRQWLTMVRYLYIGTKVAWIKKQPNQPRKVKFFDPKERIVLRPAQRFASAVPISYAEGGEAC
jgi:hypothetical protein